MLRGNRPSGDSQPAGTCGLTRALEKNMALFLSNDDVRRLLPMDECISVLEELFRQEASGSVENLARRRPS